MKLDHTFIAIRQRSIVEIFDLTLLVIRQHFQPLLILLAIGAAPWIAIDWVLTSWLAVGEFAGDYTGMYYFMTAVLVISQAQIGTSLMTYYLGQTMFVGQLSIRDTIVGTWRTSWYFWWVHGGIRFVFPLLIIALLTRNSQEEQLFGLGLFLMPVMLLVALFIRALRPFVSEMLLLERTPIRSKNDKQVNFKRRSNSLHGPASSELFGRFMAASLFVACLSFTMFAMFVKSDSVLNLQANSEFPLFTIYWVLALWLASGFAAVARFLSYIDIRIRQEGWAVELKMRAEGQRLLES